jgi:hypothetical protein
MGNRKLLVFTSILLVFAVVLPVVAQDEVDTPMVDEAPPAEESPPAPDVQPAPTPTAQPTTPPTVATATPQASGPGTTLLSDNFDDPTRAQLPLAPTGGVRSQGYADGEYEVINGAPSPEGVQDVSVPGRFSDTSISIDARLYGGITNRRNAYVMCRATQRSEDPRNAGYVFRIYPDSQMFELIRREAPDRITVLLNQASTAIRQGEATNRLELTCAGNTIRASVNGVAVATVQDGMYQAGQHRIGAGGSGTTVRFDNLVVTQR